MSLTKLLRNFKARLRASREYAVIVVLISTTALCIILIATLSGTPKSSEHEHGGHDEDHEEGSTHIELDDKTLASSNVKIAKVGETTLKPAIPVRGQIVENRNKSMIVRPRIAGLVRSAPKEYGDVVRKGEFLASIESAGARASYEIKSAIDGVIVAKNAVVGTYVPNEEIIYRIFDLSEVWFETYVPERDMDRIKIGQKIELKDRVLDARADADIFYVSNVIDEDTQSFVVRARLRNDSGAWKIGSFAEGNIQLPEKLAKIAVRRNAVQTIEGSDVVFLKHGNEIRPVPVEIGQFDKDWFEILSGDLPDGSDYVAENSFLVKAELLKSTAEHED